MSQRTSSISHSSPSSSYWPDPASRQPAGSYSATAAVSTRSGRWSQSAGPCTWDSLHWDTLHGPTGAWTGTGRPCLRWRRFGSPIDWTWRLGRYPIVRWVYKDGRSCDTDGMKTPQWAQLRRPPEVTILSCLHDESSKVVGAGLCVFEALNWPNWFKYIAVNLNCRLFKFKLGLINLSIWDHQVTH